MKARTVRRYTAYGVLITGFLLLCAAALNALPVGFLFVMQIVIFNGTNAELDTFLRAAFPVVMSLSMKLLGAGTAFYAIAWGIYPPLWREICK